MQSPRSVLPLLALCAAIAFPTALWSQSLAEKRVLAEQVAAQNDVPGNAAASIAQTLADAFGTTENTSALIDAAGRLAAASPDQAEAIAAAASVFMPSAAPAIAAAVASAVPSSAASVAAAVCQVAPASAADIAGAVAQAVPAAALQVAQSVAAVVPGQADAIAAAVSAAAPNANAAAVLAAANQGALQNGSADSGSSGFGGGGVNLPSGGGGGGGGTTPRPSPQPSPQPSPPPPPPAPTSLVITDANYAQVTKDGVIAKFPFASYTTVVVETSESKPVAVQVLEGGTLKIAGKPAEVTVGQFKGGTIDVAKDNDVTLQGGTSSGTITGAGGVIKSGEQSLTLGGSNTYTGGTTVMSGALILAPEASLPTGGDVSVQGGQLNLGGNTVPQKVGNVSLSGGTLANGSLDAASYAVSGGTASANLGGSGALTKTGDGTVTLTGANTYAGGTTVSGGTLAGNATSLQGAITNNAVVAFDQGTAGTYAGVMSGTGTMTKTGDGVLTLTGANNYTGGTTVSGGTLAGNATSLQGSITNNANVTFNQTAPGTYAGSMSGTGTLTKNDAGELTLTGPNSYSGGTTVNAGTVIGFAGNEVVASSLQGNITAASGTTVIFRQPLSGDANFAGNYTGVVSGAGQLRFEQVGTVNISSVQALTGATFIGGGAIVTLAAEVGALSALSGLTIDGGLLNLGGNTQAIASLALLGGGEIDGGVLSSTGALNLQVGTINASISSASALNKTGTGEVILGGFNTFDGPTIVREGTLRLNSGDALSAMSEVTVDGPAAVLNLGGESATALAVILRGGGSIKEGVLTAGAFSLFEGEVSASLAGSGVLNMEGTSVVTLSGNNRDFLGEAIVTSGTLLLADDDALSGAALVSVLEGATLDLGTTEAAINALALSGGVLRSDDLAGGILEVATVNISGSSTLNALLSSTEVVIADGKTTLERAGVLNEVTNVVLNGGATLDIGIFDQDLQGGGFTLNAGTITGAGTLTAATFDFVSGTVDGVSLAGDGTMTIRGEIGLGSANHSQFTGNVTVQDGGKLTGALATLGGNLEVLVGGTAAFSGAGIFAGAISGDGTVTKTGAGDLILSGNSSSFTGSFIVEGGSVSGAPTDLPASLSVAANAVVSFTDGGTYAGSLSGAGTVSATLGTTLVLSGDNAQHTGTFNVNGATVDLAGSGTYAGNFSGSGTLTKTGAGTLNLTGNNSGFSGSTSINEGVLNLDNANALRGNVTVANGATLNTAVNVDLGTSAQVILNGGTLGGTAELAAGTFNVESGTVSTFLAGNQLNKTGSGVLTVSTEDALAKVLTTTVRDNGTLDIGTNNQDLGLANSTLMVLEQGKVVSGNDRGASTITVDNFNAQEGEITVNLVTTLVKNGAGTVDLKGTSYQLQADLDIADGTLRLFQAPDGSNPLSFVGAPNIAGSGTFEVVLLADQAPAPAPAEAGTRMAMAAQSTSTPSFDFNFNFSGNINVVISGDVNQTVNLSGSNTSTGSTTIAGGTVLIDAASEFGAGLNVTGGSLDITDTAFDKVVVLNGGTITSSTGSGSIDATNLTVVSGTLNVGLTGNYRLTKNDPGVLVLSQVNTYTGGTEINAGTLVITQTGALPGYNVAGQVDVNLGAALAVGNAVDDAAVAEILATGNLKSGSSLGFDTTGGSRTYGTAIDGSIGLVKVGTGELTLTAANTFTGNVGIQGGSLILGNASAIPSGRDVSLTGGTLNVGAFDPSLGAITAESGSLVGAGTVTVTSFTKTGTESFVIAGNLTGPATINVNGGTLQIGNGSMTGSVGSESAIATSVGASLIFNRSDNPIFANVISGAGSVEQSGSGSITLSGENTFTGNMLVSSGTLALGNASALGSAAVTVANGGTLSVNAGINATTSASLVLNGGTISGAGTLSAGSFELNGGTVAAALAGMGAMTVTGTVNLNAASTRTGATTVSSGATLNLGNADAVGSSAVTVALGGTLDVGNGASSASLILNGGTVSGTGSLTADTYTLNSGVVNASLAGDGVMTVTGTVSLNGASASYSGATTVNVGGTLNLGNNGALGSSSVTVDGGTLSVGSGITATSETLTLSGGTISGAGSLEAKSYVLNSGAVAAVLTGSGSMAVNGAVSLIAANTYTGTATVNSGGTLSLANANAVSAASVTVASGGTLNVGSLTANVGSLNLTGGTLAGTSTGRLSGSGTFTLTGGTVNVGLSGTAAVLVNGPITLNRANNYAGGTTIGAGGNLTLGVRNAISGALVVNGGTLNVGSNPQTLGAVTLNGGAINGDSTITSTSGYTLSDGTVSAPLAGSGPVLIESGTVNLTGLNVFTGTTTISSGATLIGTVSSISSPQVVNDGQLQMSATTNRTFAGAISGSGGFVKDGAGTITLVGTNTYSGGTVITAGGLAGTTASLQGNITNNGSLSFNQGSNGTYSGVLSGTGSLTKLGGGAVTFTANNAYTGTTTIGGGRLFVEGDQSGATGAVTVAAGATLGGKGTVGGATSIIGLHRMGASQTGNAPDAPGVQTFSQSLTYQSGAQAFWRLTANTDDLVARGTAYDGANIAGALEVLNAASMTFNLSFNAPGSTVDWTNTFWDLNQGAIDPRGWLVYDAASLNINGLQNNFNDLERFPNLNDPSLWLDSQGQALGAVRPDYTFAFFVDEENSDVYLNYIYRRAP